MMKRNLMVVGLALLLSACGFQLRGTGEEQFALHELNVSARNAYGPTVKEVRRALEARGVKISANAPYHLLLVDEREQPRTVAYTRAGRSSEFELTQVLSYQILSADNLPLLNNSIEAQNIYVQDNNNLIGSGQEAEQVRKEMRHDLVQQLVQQLQVISPAQLARLNEQAKAKAEADRAAAEAARQAIPAPQASPIQFPIQ